MASGEDFRGLIRGLAKVHSKAELHLYHVSRGLNNLRQECEAKIEALETNAEALGSHVEALGFHIEALGARIDVLEGKNVSLELNLGKHILEYNGLENFCAQELGDLRRAIQDQQTNSHSFEQRFRLLEQRCATVDSTKLRAKHEYFDSPTYSDASDRPAKPKAKRHCAEHSPRTFRMTLRSQTRRKALQ